MVKRRLGGSLGVMVAGVAGAMLAGCFALFSLDDYGGGAPGTASLDADVTTTDGTTDADARVDASAGPADGQPPMMPSVYVLGSGKKLYAFDAVKLTYTTFADLMSCPDLREIAVDRNHQIIAVATPENGSVQSIAVSAGVGRCTKLRDNGDFPALAFIGTGSSSSTLVAYDLTNRFLRVDPATAAATRIGTGDRPGPYNDLAQGDGTTVYAVERNQLVAVNAVTGATERLVAPLSDDFIAGVAFAEGKIFAFSRTGAVHVIMVAQSGSMTMRTVMVSPGEWLGAASPPP